MPLTIEFSASEKGELYEKFWNVCVGAGRANEGLRAGWLEQLSVVAEQCGFKYVRFHGLFHDDMFVYREDAQGLPTYNFQYINELFDRLLDIGVKPFVEFGFSPGAMARKTNTVFWWRGNGSPPVDYDKWTDLIRRVITNWIERYGIEEVRSWYFEVWNEPNLYPFFAGTKSEYFKLYDVTCHAVKSIDNQLRIGGPATSNFVPDARFDGETEDVNQHQVVINATDLDDLNWKPVWLSEFMEYCFKNACPLDFISCHPYPTDWALDIDGRSVKSTRGVDATQRDLRLLRDMVSKSKFPDVEIHLTEWSSSPSPRDHTHDYLQAATFIVKANLESIGLVDSLSYWTFTDIFEENGAGDSSFHGGFGMINFQGICKPSFHAYRMLNALGEYRIAQNNGIIATRRAEDQKLSLLAYHYPAEMKFSVPASMDSSVLAEQVMNMGTPDRLSIKITDIPPERTFIIETLDREYGNAVATWNSMGKPNPLSREQTAILKCEAVKTRVEYAVSDHAGTLLIDRPINPWSLVLVYQL